jgi:hypothetical protein
MAVMMLCAFELLCFSSSAQHISSGALLSAKQNCKPRRPGIYFGSAPAMASSEADRKKVALRRLGDATFSKLDKVSAELFSLTYGAVVTQLIKDYEDVKATNTQLEKMCACRLHWLCQHSYPPAR